MRSAACLLLVVAVAGCWSKREESKRELEKVQREQEADDFDKVLKHKWWKKPPTKERLNEIVELIKSTNTGSTVFFDDDANTGVIETYKSVFHNPHVTLPPKGVGQRHGYYSASGTKRPDKASVLTSLLSELDRVEYRDGPGR